MNFLVNPLSNIAAALFKKWRTKRVAGSPPSSTLDGGMGLSEHQDLSPGLNITEATDLANATIHEWWPDSDFVIDDAATREFTLGWIFLYNTPRYLETRDARDGLTGNAPILVDRETGHVELTGIAHPIDHYVAEYVSQRSQP